MSIAADDTIVLVFDATQDARHAALLRVNELARGMVDRSKAAAAGQKPDEHGEVPGPQQLRIVLGMNVEDKSTKQRAFLHAAVFPQIAEKYVFPDGSRFAAPVWKEFFRARFLGDKWESRRALRWDRKACQMVLAKRATPHRIRVSTEDLNIKQYSQYIDTVIDTAVSEFGVVFEFRADEREAVRWNHKRRKAGEQKHEPVDQSTAVVTGPVPRPGDVPSVHVDEPANDAGPA